METHAFFFNTPVNRNFIGHQLSEIYRDNVYGQFFEGKNLDTVLDIGANIGMTAYYFAQHARKVHSIEPSVEHFEVLTQMVNFNKLDNVIPHKMAIWIKNSDNGVLHHNQNKTMFSLHGAIDDNTEASEVVKVRTLDKFFEENEIEHVDFMKIDVEGSEFEILGGEGFRKVAPKVNTVFLEWHDWADRNPAQLEQSLKNNGFQVSTVNSTAKLMVGTK